MGHYEERARTPIEINMENLVQLGIVKSNAIKQKRAIKNILKNCESEFEMSRKLHDLWVGNKTVDQFIAQYGNDLIVYKEDYLIAINGNLFLYKGIEFVDGLLRHKVECVDIDEDGILTAVCTILDYSSKELKQNEIKFTKKQLYGIVEYFIRVDYNLTEEEINGAVEDIVGREFAYGVPKTIEDLKRHIAKYLNR